jgi:hypothetical protein
MRRTDFGDAPTLLCDLQSQSTWADIRKRASVNIMQHLAIHDLMSVSNTTSLQIREKDVASRYNASPAQPSKHPSKAETLP